jgi:hypothetical protein
MRGEQLRILNFIPFSQARKDMKLSLKHFTSTRVAQEVAGILRSMYWYCMHLLRIWVALSELTFEASQGVTVHRLF